MNRYFFAAAAALVCAGLLGCGTQGPSTVTASGKLTKKGQPLQIANTVFKTMVLYPHEVPENAKEYRTYSAIPQPDGSFQVFNIPPGKYLIVLELLADGGDMCSGLFTKQNSKLVREVTGREPIHIDITKPKGE